MGQRSTILRKILNSNRAKKGPWKKLSNLFFGHLDFLSSCKGFLALHFLLAITLVCCQVVVSCWPQRY